MKEWKGYLFDLDGTLIDTKEMIYRCFNKLMVDFYKRELSREDVFKYIGLPYREQLEKYTGVLSEEQFAELVDAHRKFQKLIYADYVSPCPGVVETIKKLADLGKPMGVVTSRLRPSSQLFLETFDLFRYFQVMITPTETVLHKPNPQPVQKALELLQLKSSETVFVGDSVYDILAGFRSGVSTVYVDWEKQHFNFQVECRPDYCIDNMTQLLPGKG